MADVTDYDPEVYYGKDRQPVEPHDNIKVNRGTITARVRVSFKEWFLKKQKLIESIVPPRLRGLVSAHLSGYDENGLPQITFSFSSAEVMQSALDKLDEIDKTFNS